MRSPCLQRYVSQSNLIERISIFPPFSPSSRLAGIPLRPTAVQTYFEIMLTDLVKLWTCLLAGLSSHLSFFTLSWCLKSIWGRYASRQRQRVIVTTMKDYRNGSERCIAAIVSPAWLGAKVLILLLVVYSSNPLAYGGTMLRKSRKCLVMAPLKLLLPEEASYTVGRGRLFLRHLSDL